jgi:hypothetical protein
VDDETFDFVRAYRRLPPIERFRLLTRLGLLTEEEVGSVRLSDHEWDLVAFERARERETVPELAMAIRRATKKRRPIEEDPS